MSAIVTRLSREDQALVNSTNSPASIEVSFTPDVLRTEIISHCLEIIKYDIFDHGRISLLALEVLEYISRILTTRGVDVWKSDFRLRTLGVYRLCLWVRTVDSCFFELLTRQR